VHTHTHACTVHATNLRHPYAGMLLAKQSMPRLAAMHVHSGVRGRRIDPARQGVGSWALMTLFTLMLLTLRAASLTASHPCPA
jgi:hypothetical protein